MGFTLLFQKNRYAVVCLSANFVFSLYMIWGTLWRNGFFDAVSRIWRVGPHVLPGSNNPILTTYLGVRPLDELLAFSTILFTHFTDGSTPSLSLFAFYFTGQWATILIIVFMEGLRSGNQGTIMSLSVVWLIFMQCITYGCGIPVYCLTHLLTSKTAVGLAKTTPEHVAVKNLAHLKAIPVAIIIGYICPTVLMSVHLDNNLLHQWLGGAWQGHPLWILPVQLLVANSTLLNRSNLSEADARQISSKMPVFAGTLSRAHAVTYLFAFGVAAFTHYVSFTILMMRMFFPSLFSARANESFTFAQVYQPAFLRSNKVLTRMPTIVHAFLQYDLYLGSLTTIFWALTLYLRSRRSALGQLQGICLLLKAVCVMVIAGPAAVVPYLLWSRDEELLRSQTELKLN